MIRWVFVSWCCLAGFVAAETSVAVIAESGRQAPQAQIVASIEVALSRQLGFGLVERARIKEILGERDLSLSGMTDPATALRLGQLLSVDLFLFAGNTMVAGAPGVRARIIESRTGLALGQFSASGVLLDQDPAVVGREVQSARAKMEVQEEERLFIGPLGFRSETYKEDLQEQADRFAVVFVEEIGRLPNVVLLEREHLDRLTAERDLSGVDLRLKSSALLLEGSLRSGPGKAEITTTFAWRRIASDRREFLERCFPAEGLDTVSQSLAKELFEKLRASPVSGSGNIGNLGREADVFANRAKDLLTHHEHEAALKAAETAFALCPEKSYRKLVIETSRKICDDYSNLSVVAKDASKAFGLMADIRGLSLTLTINEEAVRTQDQNMLFNRLAQVQDQGYYIRPLNAEEIELRKEQVRLHRRIYSVRSSYYKNLAFDKVGAGDKKHKKNYADYLRETIKTLRWLDESEERRTFVIEQLFPDIEEAMAHSVLTSEDLLAIRQEISREWPRRYRDDGLNRFYKEHRLIELLPPLQPYSDWLLSRTNPFWRDTGWELRFSCMEYAIQGLDNFKDTEENRRFILERLLPDLEAAIEHSFFSPDDLTSIANEISWMAHAQPYKDWLNRRGDPFLRAVGLSQKSKGNTGRTLDDDRRTDIPKTMQWDMGGCIGSILAQSIKEYNAFGLSAFPLYTYCLKGSDVKLPYRWIVLIRRAFDAVLANQWKPGDACRDTPKGAIDSREKEFVTTAGRPLVEVQPQVNIVSSTPWGRYAIAPLTLGPGPREDMGGIVSILPMGENLFVFRVRSTGTTRVNGVLVHVNSFSVTRAALAGGAQQDWGSVCLPATIRIDGFPHHRQAASENRCYCAIPKWGICAFSPDKAGLISENDNLLSTDIHSLAFCSGRLYVGFDSAFGAYDPSTGSFVTLGSAKRLQPRHALDGGLSYTVEAMLADVQRNCLWLSVRGRENHRSGLWKYDIEDGSLLKIPLKEAYEVPRLAWSGLDILMNYDATLFLFRPSDMTHAPFLFEDGQTMGGSLCPNLDYDWPPAVVGGDLLGSRVANCNGVVISPENPGGSRRGESPFYVKGRLCGGLYPTGNALLFADSGNVWKIVPNQWTAGHFGPVVVPHR